MSGQRSSIDGRDPAWWDSPASGPGAPERGPRAKRDAPVPRAASDDAARVFARAMRGGEDGAQARDRTRDDGADAQTGHGGGARHDSAFGEAGEEPARACDALAASAAPSRGIPRDRENDAVRERRGRAFDGERDGDDDTAAASRVRDVWSLFATGAVGRAAIAPSPGAMTAAPAPRDVVDDLFAMVVALRGDGSGAAVMELDLDEHTLPGVSIRIARVDDRLCFTFLCRRVEGFRRLAADAATMADLLRERLARPVGVAVRRVNGGEEPNTPAAANDDADVAVEAG